MDFYRSRLVLAFALAAAPCAADPVPTEPEAASPAPSVRVGLVYRVPDDCPGRSVLVEAVAARLGEDPFVSESPWGVEVAITRHSGELTATVTLHREGEALGERTLRAGAHQCRDLVGSVAVTLAVLLEPHRLSALAARSSQTPSPPRSTPPAPMPDGGPPPANEDPFHEDDRVAHDTKPAARWALRVGVGGHGALGAAPKPNAGVDAWLGIRSSDWSLNLGGRADFPRSDVDAQGLGVSAGWLAGSLAPCRHFGPALACALLLAGQVRGEGIGVAPPDRESTWFFAGGLRAGLELALDRTWAFTTSAEGLVVPTRTTQRIGSEPRWTSPMFSGALGIGIRAEIQ